MGSARKERRVAALVESSIAELNHGRVDRAVSLCEQALGIAPRDPDALHLAGILALQRSDHAAAAIQLEKAVAARPDAAAYRANLAYAYIGLKRLPEALAAFERATKLDPRDAELQLGLGNCLAMTGKAQEAETVLRRLADRQPLHAPVWFNLANAVRDQKRNLEARDLYERATQLAPGFTEAHCNLGIVQHELSRFEAAERAFRTAIALDGSFAPAHLNLALTLNSLRRHREAEEACRTALARDPEQNNAWPILGRALLGQGRFREAARYYDKAVAHHPGNPEVLGELGHALARIGKTSQALDTFDRAYALGAVSPFVHFYKATTLFSIGRIADGAAAYLGRPARSTFVEQHPQLPLSWELPRDLARQTFGLIGEQGIGDELFFLRFAPSLKMRGCSILYCGNPKIADMLARNSLFERVSTTPGAIADTSCRALVGDLPHLLSELESSSLDLEPPAGVDEEAQRPFRWHCRAYWPEIPPPLQLEPLSGRLAEVRSRLQAMGPAPYTGLTWRAGTKPQEEHGQVWSLFKEVPLEALAASLSGTTGTLLSLQRDPAPGETQRLAALAGRPVHDLSALNDNLEEMLALLATIDEYIGVSNTNTHLRASAGRTGRVIVPWPAEWRWMTAGDTSPWFPGFSIYRQQPDGDWSPAFRRLADDLASETSTCSLTGGIASQL